MADRQTFRPEDLARELDLNAEERAYVDRYRVTSIDELHARLLASPSLADQWPGIRRAPLLGKLEPLLSKAYRKALAGPLPDVTWGVTSDAAWARNGLHGWPGATLSPNLDGENAGVDLLGNLRGIWPVRDQGFSEPTCVPFAANACLEWAALTPGIGTQRLGSVFLYQRIRSQLGPPQGQGGARLTEVASVLPVSGVCREAVWPDSAAILAAPSAAALQDALTRRRGAECADLGWQNPARPQGAARVVLELLRQGLPVTITIPTFAEKGAARTNWTDAFALTTGLILEKEDTWVRVGGHAVCILGFQPTAKDPLGGHFVFRNSWGSRFATQPLSPAAAPGQGTPLEPTVPGIGYGVIGASQIEAYATEILVFP